MGTDIIITSETPSETTVIGIKRTILTDAQIKALPSTQIELVAAPGVNKAIIPVTVFGILKISAGAYTNVTDASFQILAGGATISTTFLAEGALNQNANIFVVNFLLPYCAPSAGIFSTEISTYPITTVSQLANQPLKIGDVFGGVSNYTGGNAANTFEVTVYYVIVDV